MSTVIRHATVQGRAAAATRTLRSALGIEDLKLLSASIAEAAAEEVERNVNFARRVQRIYEELAHLQINSRAGKNARPDNVELQPLPGAENVRVDPFGPLDPYLLLRLYGPHQLRTALSVYSLSKLKEAARTVMERDAGTRPRDARKLDAVTDYIVEHVAGPTY